jgi:hypothetical protein
MMVGTEVGSEIRQPPGYAIVGGLALSHIPTLYTTPVVYIYLDRLQSRLFQEEEANGVWACSAGTCRVSIVCHAAPRDLLRRERSP